MCRHGEGRSHAQRYLQLMMVVEQVRLAALRSAGVDERQRWERAQDLSQRGCQQRVGSDLVYGEEKRKQVTVSVLRIRMVDESRSGWTGRGSAPWGSAAADASLEAEQRELKCHGGLC